MITYFGTIENGLLKIKGRKQFDFELKQFEGKEVEISISKKKRKRSGQQNKTYWLWCGILAAELALTKEQMHDLVKCKFLTYKVYFINNIKVEKQGDVYIDINSGEVVQGEVKEVELMKSTTELTTTEFMEFMDSFQFWAKDFFNVTLPNPNEQIGIFE